MLLFHANDPKDITIADNGKAVVCKPDIALVSLGAARNALKNKGGTTKEKGDTTKEKGDTAKEKGATASWDDYALNIAGIAPGLHFAWSDCFFSVEVKRVKPKPPPSRKYALKVVDTIRPIYEIVEHRPAQGKSAQSSEREMPNPLKDAAPVFRKSQLTISYQFYRPFSTRATSSAESYTFTVQSISQFTVQHSSVSPFYDFHHFFVHLVRFKQPKTQT
jgi:hypothetical protein